MLVHVLDVSIQINVLCAEYTMLHIHNLRLCTFDSFSGITKHFHMTGIEYLSFSNLPIILQVQKNLCHKLQH